VSENMLLGIEPAHVFSLVLFGFITLLSIGFWFHRRIDIVSKRSWRTERAIMVFVKLSIQETRRLHPKNASDFKELENIVNTVLAENNSEAERFKFIK